MRKETGVKDERKKKKKKEDVVKGVGVGVKFNRAFRRRTFVGRLGVT